MRKYRKSIFKRSSSTNTIRNSKKYKNTSGTSRGAILQAVNSEGELVGHTSFIRQIEVDEQQFTKIYLSQFSAFSSLTHSL